MKNRAFHLKLELRDGRVLDHLDGSLDSSSIIDLDDTGGSHSCGPTVAYADELDERGEDPGNHHLCTLPLRSVEFPLPGVNELTRTTFLFLQPPELTDEMVEQLLTPKYGWSESDVNLKVHWGTQDQ